MRRRSCPECGKPTAHLEIREDFADGGSVARKVSMDWFRAPAFEADVTNDDTDAVYARGGPVGMVYVPHVLTCTKIDPKDRAARLERISRLISDHDRGPGDSTRSSGRLSPGRP